MLSFCLFGRKITITFGFGMVLLLLWLFAKQGDFLPCLGCCLLHECGHLLICLICSLAVGELRFSATGITLILRQNPRLLSRRQEFYLSAGGILSNLVCAIGFGLASLRFPALRDWFYCSFALALFHLIPAGGLDGGSLWRLAGSFFLPPERLTGWSTAGNLIALLLFAAAAALALWAGQTLFALTLALCGLCSILSKP